MARGKTKRADYVHFAKPNTPIAVVEANDAHHVVDDGIQQTTGSADMLRVPFAFSSNGKGFDFHARTGQSQVLAAPLALDAFPFPDTLLAKCKAWHGHDEAASKIDLHGGHDGGKTPRYDQMNAITRPWGRSPRSRTACAS